MRMRSLKQEKSQSATDYLLMLVTVLVIVAVAVIYVVGANAERAENQLENMENR